MAFTSFKSVGELVTRYGLTWERAEFVRPPADAPRLSPGVLDELAFTFAEVAFDRSEVAAREALIYPVLRDVWKHYRDRLTMLSGEPVDADADLCGEVDYVVCKRSPHGPLLPDLPLLLVGGAKRDDATVGWNQALGGMLAAQKLGGAERTYYGLTTTGTIWRFGRLAGTQFTTDPRPFGAGDWDALAAALHFVFVACRDQLDQG